MKFTKKDKASLDEKNKKYFNTGINSSSSRSSSGNKQQTKKKVYNI